MLLRILYDFPYREKSRTQKRKMRREDESFAPERTLHVNTRLTSK